MANLSKASVGISKSSAIVADQSMSLKKVEYKIIRGTRAFGTRVAR